MTAEPLWTRTSPRTGYPTLTGRTEVDVAVIGGGTAGLWTAWELAQAGLRVAVVEAGRIAGADSAAAVGVATALQTFRYGPLTDTAGSWAARQYARAQQLAVDRIAEVTGALGIDCDLELRPAYLYAESQGLVPALRREARAALASGLPVRLTASAGRGRSRLDGPAGTGPALSAGLGVGLRRPAGLPFPVAGALRLDGQLQLHPRKLLLALAADLVRLGSAVYEDSRVMAVDDGEPCVALTESGAAIVADQLVVATGYPIASTAGIRRALRTRRALVLAGPVPADRAPHGIYLTAADPSGAAARSIRSAPLPDGRRVLIVAGQVHPPGSGHVRDRLATLTSWAAERLGLTDVRHVWSVQEHTTEDRMPLVGRMSEAPEHRHTWLTAGFGGWGLTGAVAAARQLTAEIAGGEPPPWRPWFDPARLTGGAGRRGHRATAAPRSAVRSPVTSAERAAVDALEPGEGAVIDVGGEHCAVARTPDGIIHALSAVCPHLGGTVGYNDAEQVWECPCHGSRFAPDGAVLQGPAVKGLAPAAALLPR